VAINDLTSPDMLGYLFAHDIAVHGRFHGTVEVSGSDLLIDGDRMQVLAEREPAKLPWGSMGVNYVIEATRLFSSRAKAAAHLEAGAKKVMITAPGKEVDATFVSGVNHATYDPAAHHVISNALLHHQLPGPRWSRCCHETVGIRHGWLTTIHAYTNDQKILDVQHPKTCAGAGGGDQHHPDLDRRRQGDRPGLPELAAGSPARRCGCGR